jgi:DNA-binding NarL/FixJ family response regulator
VFLVNSCKFLADALGQALSAREEVVVVGSGSAPEAADAGIEDGSVEVVLVHASPNASAAIERLRGRHPALSILAIGLPDDAEVVLRFIEVGANGYVLRDAPLVELVRAIGALRRGEAHCSPRVAAAVFNRIWQLGSAGGRPAPHDLSPLSDREQQVLEFLRRGLANKEIARVLSLRISTVKNHVHRILEKLQVRHRRAAARYAAATACAPLPADPAAGPDRFHARAEVSTMPPPNRPALPAKASLPGLSSVP